MCRGGANSDSFGFWIWDPLTEMAYSGEVPKDGVLDEDSRATLDRLYFQLHRSFVLPASKSAAQKESRPESLGAIYNIVKSDNGELLRMMRLLALGSKDMPSSAWYSTTQKAKLSVGPWVASQVILA